MPTDRCATATAGAIRALHNGGDRLARAVGLGLNLTLNRVSDDNYWRDFPRAPASLTQRLLPNDGNLSWARAIFRRSVRALKWQTLQDVTAPIVPPYDRLPQLIGRYARANVGGFDCRL